MCAERRPAGDHRAEGSNARADEAHEAARTLARCGTGMWSAPPKHAARNYVVVQLALGDGGARPPQRVMPCPGGTGAGPVCLDPVCLEPVCLDLVCLDPVCLDPACRSA